MCQCKVRPCNHCTIQSDVDDDQPKQPADWAYRKALILARHPLKPSDSLKANSYWTAFARYIEAHEGPPVDPDLQLAREVFASLYTAEKTKEAAMNGSYDNHLEMKNYLTVIKATRAADKKTS